MQSKEPFPNRETALVEALSRKFGPPPPGVVLGIGDDCAALSLDGADYLLWTVDTLVEGVHFELSYTPLTRLGRKSLVVNLSDIAAMGGIPLYALLSLSWPPAKDRAGALELGQGLAQAAREYGVAVIGGDTVASAGPLMVTVTVLGRVPGDEMVRRAGARVGDRLYVTGPLGESAAGLGLLQGRPDQDIDPSLKTALSQAHLDPQPQLKAGRLLARQRLATAMIDLSDGLATDLFHVCRASAVAARIDAAAVPVSPRVKAVAPILRQDPLDLALKGGEDYQLLFTSPPELAGSLAQAFSQAGLPSPVCLGEIVPGEGVLLVTPTGDRDIAGAGYDHFRLDLPKRSR
jgi:thiamine-monophosphate kinase